jgi:hypothetical protein
MSNEGNIFQRGMDSIKDSLGVTKGSTSDAPGSLPGVQLGYDNPTGSRAHGLFTGNEAGPDLRSTVQSGQSVGGHPRDVDKVRCHTGCKHLVH